VRTQLRDTFTLRKKYVSHLQRVQRNVNKCPVSRLTFTVAMSNAQPTTWRLTVCNTFS